MVKGKINCIRWAVDLRNFRPSFQELCTAVSCVQPEEKDRLMKFVYRDDFDSSLVGRLLMRKFIRDITGIPYDRIKFGRDNRGKPYLVNAEEILFNDDKKNDSRRTLEIDSRTSSFPLMGREQIDFNVSHQGNFCVLAGIYATNFVEKQDENKSNLGKGKENPIEMTVENHEQKSCSVGIDVMKIEYTGGKPLKEFFRLMDRNFSEEEWTYIKNQQSENKQLESFMRNWCLKESYVKNVGVGITIDLRKISFNIKKKNTEEELAKDKVITSTTLKVNGVNIKDWLFEEQLLDEEHCVAIAYKLPGNEEIDIKPFKILVTGDLLENVKLLTETDKEYCHKVESKSFKKTVNMR